MIQHALVDSISNPHSSLFTLLLAYVLISEQRPFPARFMIDNRCRIAQFLELATGHIVRGVMYGFPLQVFEFWHPIANVVAVRIALFRLGQCVEDALRVSKSGFE